MALTAIAATAVAAEKDFLPYTEVDIAIHTYTYITNNTSLLSNALS